jgi:UDP:flavonoid glycosyltransferase YjiC (YdhE family)/glycosyltransferase involved in cell wall biosynthesis
VNRRPILVTAAGLRAEVTPLIAIARALEMAGHDVRCVFPSWVRQDAPDLSEVIDSEVDVSSQRRNVRVSPQQRVQIAALSGLPHRLPTLIAAAENATLIVANDRHVAASVVARRRGIHVCSVVTNPGRLEHPEIGTSDQGRKEPIMEAQRTLLLSSAYFAVPELARYPNLRMTGFLPPSRPAPAGELDAWLGGGPPPLLFDEGELPSTRDPHVRQVVAEAARLLQMRLVICPATHMPKAERTAIALELSAAYASDVFVASRNSVIGRLDGVAAIVSPGDFGLVSEALQAARPMVLLPHTSSQRFAALALRRLGVGTGLEALTLQPENLALAIKARALNHQVGAACDALAERLPSDDAPLAVTTLIDELLRPAEGHSFSVAPVATTDDKPWLSVIITSMGRLHHLEQSIPALVAFEGLEVVLVDYSCPDHCGAVVKNRWPAVRVVEVRGQTVFNKSKALNVGLAAASAEWVAMVDADMVVAPCFADELKAALRPDRVLGRDAAFNETGFIVARRSEVLAIGGYDTRMEGWGYEDDDLRQRLLDRGLTLHLVKAEVMTLLEHTEAERVGNYRERNRERSARFNKAIGWRARYPDSYGHAAAWPLRFTIGLAGPTPGDAWLAVQSAIHATHTLGAEVVLSGRIHQRTKDNPLIVDKTTWLFEMLSIFDGGESIPVVQGTSELPMISAPVFPFPVGTSELSRHWNPPRRARPMVAVHGLDAVAAADWPYETTLLDPMEGPLAWVDALCAADAVALGNPAFLPICASLGVPTIALRPPLGALHPSTLAGGTVRFVETHASLAYSIAALLSSAPDPKTSEVHS